VSSGQDLNFTQFYINPALLNPSYTGTEGRPALFMSYRKQWMGLEGSPSTMNFSVQTSLPNRVNLGLNASNQKVGLVSSTGAMLMGGYTLPLSAHNSVRFGASAGGTFTRVDINNLNFGSSPGNNPNDPLLANLADNSFQLAGNLGISYHTKTFHGGVSMPALFHPVYLTQGAFQPNFKPFDNLIVHASNRFYLQKGKNVFEPYVVYRLSKGLPGQFEVAAVYHYMHVGWIGASYKQDFGMSGLLGFKMNKLLALGYSYSLPTSGPGEINKASHEIHLAYLFGQHKKPVVVAYSIVDTDLPKAETKKKPVVAAAKPVPKKEVPKKPEPKPPSPAPNVVVDVVPGADPMHAEEQDKLKRLEEHADDPFEEHNETHHPHAERHELIKQGGHHDEVELGNHIVAGVFRSEANAKHYYEGLLKMGFEGLDYGYLSEKKLWYVHFVVSEDINEARAKRDELRELFVFKDAWLLTVHN